MTRPAIAYTSRYGSTRQYASALAGRLGVPAIDLADTAPAHDADPLIVLAPIYATRILGRRRIIRAIRGSSGRAALVVVGLSPADDPGRAALAARLTTATRRPVATFHVRGELDPGRLTRVDHILVSALRRALSRTPDEPMARLLLPGDRVDLVDEATLDPVVAWAAGEGATGP